MDCAAQGMMQPFTWTQVCVIGIVCLTICWGLYLMTK